MAHEDLGAGPRGILLSRNVARALAYSVPAATRVSNTCMPEVPCAGSISLIAPPDGHTELPRWGHYSTHTELEPSHRAWHSHIYKAASHT
jgi:hypothetical protein